MTWSYDGKESAIKGLTSTQLKILRPDTILQNKWLMISGTVAFSSTSTNQWYKGPALISIAGKEEGTSQGESFEGQYQAFRSFLQWQAMERCSFNSWVALMINRVCSYSCWTSSNSLIERDLIGERLIFCWWTTWAAIRLDKPRASFNVSEYL